MASISTADRQCSKVRILCIILPVIILMFKELLIGLNQSRFFFVVFVFTHQQLRIDRISRLCLVTDTSVLQPGTPGLTDAAKPSSTTASGRALLHPTRRPRWQRPGPRDPGGEGLWDKDEGEERSLHQVPAAAHQTPPLPVSDLRLRLICRHSAEDECGQAAAASGPREKRHFWG